MTSTETIRIPESPNYKHTDSEFYLCVCCGRPVKAPKFFP